MAALMRGKRAGLLALGAALATMLALGVTLGVAQRGDAPTTGCTEAALGGARAEHAELAADCDALLASRDALAGAGALDWSAGAPLAEWDGVTVSGEPSRVTGLDLRARGLTGSIPTQLGSLTALTALDLSDNALTGSIPAGMRELPPTLATLHLAGNSFTGCIDERLRLAETNDLAALMTARSLVWCPVATAPKVQPLAAGTYHIDNELIIDIPVDGPQVKAFAIIIASVSGGGGGIYHCLSDINEQRQVCFSAHTGEEGVRGPANTTTRPGVPDTSTASVPAGLDEVFDKIAATARLVP